MTSKLLQRVYRFLSFRDRSEKEIRDFLQRKKAQNPDEIIDNLKEQGLINDEKFAKAWVEARRRSKNKGERALRMELAQKGIERSIIERVISDELIVHSEEQIAENALEKKARIWKALDINNFRKKATDFLMRKGFEYEVVKKIIDKFLKT